MYPSRRTHACTTRRADQGVVDTSVGPAHKQVDIDFAGSKQTCLTSAGKGGAGAIWIAAAKCLATGKR